MANKTWLELSKALRREAGVQGDGPDAVTGQTGIYANLVQWIDQAWVDVQGMKENWKFMWGTDSFTTTTGTAVYDEVPADFRSIKPHSIIATNPDGDSTSGIEYADWSYFGLKTRGTILANDYPPSFISIRPDGKFVFDQYTEAGWAVAFEYSKAPSNFTASDSVTTWPAEYDYLLVYKALIDYGMFYNAPEAVQHGQLRYQEALSRLLDDQLVRPTVRLGRLLSGGNVARNRFI